MSKSCGAAHVQGLVEFALAPAALVPLRTAGVMSLVVATVLAMAAAGLRAGMPRGAPRLARHLWRMCFALFIAAGSFFSVRERVAKVLPAPFTTGPMRPLPILLLFASMFYRLWRVRRHKALPGLVRYDPAPVHHARLGQLSHGD